MNIPGIGPVSVDSSFGWYRSEPIPVPGLGGRLCRICLQGYDADLHPKDFHKAIAHFLAPQRDFLGEAEPYVYQYFEDRNSDWDPGDEEYVEMDRADLWDHVRIGDEPMVCRRPYGDNGIYISLEGSCDWEPEHGLQIVLKDGLIVNKVGPYDGHLTNSDAYADPSLENVIFRQLL